jgi:hypothetical protein
VDKKVADASFLVSAICTYDDNHWGCYDYLKSHEDDVWIMPMIAYFEYQATQSRIAQDGYGAIDTCMYRTIGKYMK